eukprot:CAMPEP_0194137508 /NCGR_PEP_ID=MMETSP0152-20130528/7392_1 /TAXON_ID=1049557 /ORGANISM="Thalassiothrix antarctica, Strain L6-D1" /LENGTH=553 /DNA_ID=CAMNT_0038834561 /DNA_START=167 /DNA_END=1828 /DNA_ORIENTATION=-
MNINLALVFFLKSRGTYALTSFLPCLRSTTTHQYSEFTTDVSATDLPTDDLPTEWQGEVLEVLRNVIDPDLNKDIVTLGFVKNLVLGEDRKVTFEVELTTAACQVKEQFAAECKSLVSGLDWTGEIDVTMTSQSVPENTETTGMSQVGAVISVSSCKGGVGKSTTAVNLAFALQSLGASVGIFDADIYGPSLPTMVNPDDDLVRFIGRQIAPLQRNGVSLMSFGYINEGSAVMRGPMVTQLLDQFLSVTNWGSLDYLIIDMPPGTGDIQLTLTQKLNITAAVIVTTPQELSFVDVERGIEMFDSVNVPCIAVVENMAYYELEKPLKPEFDSSVLQGAFAEKLKEAGVCQNGASAKDLAAQLVEIAQISTPTSLESEQVRIFGPGHKKRLSDQWGIQHTYSVPLMNRIAANGDSGTPFILEYPNSPQAAIYKQLATSVVSEVSKTKFDKNSLRPVIEYNEDFHFISIDDEYLEPVELRRVCRCAACVEELTGRQILTPSSVSEDIKPIKMYPCGNYAHSIDWSDGHKSLYPYRQIRSLLQEMAESEYESEENET